MILLIFIEITDLSHNKIIVEIYRYLVMSYKFIYTRLMYKLKDPIFYNIASCYIKIYEQLISWKT